VHMAAVLVLTCFLGVSCSRSSGEPPSEPVLDSKPDWLCSDEIPNSNQHLFEYRFGSAWAMTDDVWGYAIDDSASKISRNHLNSLPRGRLFKITRNGTVHLSSFADYDPSVGEKTIRHVIRGVPVIEYIFHTDGNGWRRGNDYHFDGVEAAGERIVFSVVRDSRGNLIRDRLEVDAGGMVAHDKDGILQFLEGYRVEPSPDTSPKGTKRRLFYDRYSPFQGRTIHLEQLPSRGICKGIHRGNGI